MSFVPCYRVEWRLGRGHPWSSTTGGECCDSLFAAKEFLSLYIAKLVLAQCRVHEYRIIHLSLDSNRSAVITVLEGPQDPELPRRTAWEKLLDEDLER